MSNIDDMHDQSVLLRGHDNFISCLALSPSAALAATGQIGLNSDVVLWDMDQMALKYRFEEHDYGVVALAFSHDDK